jgi:plasmid stabilization system protein ParE
MLTAVWAPQAVSDLEDILYYIRVTAEQPLTAHRIGQAAPPNWRYYRYKRWLIFFQPHSQGIEVMRVVDGARDLPRALADESE